METCVYSDINVHHVHAEGKGWTRSRLPATPAGSGSHHSPGGLVRSSTAERINAAIFTLSQTHGETSEVPELLTPSDHFHYHQGCYDRCARFSSSSAAATAASSSSLVRKHVGRNTAAYRWTVSTPFDCFRSNICARLSR